MIDNLAALLFNTSMAQTDYRMFQLVVTAIALLYLFFRSRTISRQGMSTMPEVVQILMWGSSLVLAMYLPERIGPVPIFILELIVIVIVSTRLNLWRVKKMREEEAEKRRMTEAIDVEDVLNNDDSHESKE